VWIYGRDSSAGIATSYRLDGPGSIPNISRFSFVLSSYVLISCILILYNLYYFRITVYILLIVYIALPPGISPTAVGNTHTH
jgi:hypothetical protein